MGQTLGGLVVHSGHLPLSPLRVFASRFGQNEGFGIIAEEGGLVLDEHKKEDGNTGERRPVMSPFCPCLTISVSVLHTCVYIYRYITTPPPPSTEYGVHCLLSCFRPWPLVAKLTSVSG